MLLSAAAQHALHPATRVAEDHSLISEIVVFGDLCFNVTINQQHTWSDSPPLGYRDAGPVNLVIPSSHRPQGVITIL
ncbi:hypothetical protein [Spongiactinospora sp. TRM90649]|uniref:hypothetical protein n=1 Tax=Spongiactinospora sp. TRM90649 TaxID=3031114 RepID=UPI0023F668C0|nr:hypothetical protein [Spongiactinospora sp. TRM90649]MDF5757361.1 hypothetical protein [Spongiactinospora sp. TRM90649]